MATGLGGIRAARLAVAVLTVTAAHAACHRAGPASAQTTIIEGESISLATSGYLRSLTGLHHRGYDLPTFDGGDPPPRASGFHGQLLRVKWFLEGGQWRVEMHDRLQVRVTSESDGGQPVGFGIGAEPDRLVSLRTDLLDRERVRAWHDIDRLSLTVLTPGADLTLGRQAITWGVSGLFPVADLWAAFSPFEQDTDEKPGIDAARALLYPGQGVEMDVVVAHRGHIEDLSAGVRATVSRTGADLWAGGGKFWRQLMGMGGVTLLRDHTRWRAEAVVPWDMDQRSFQRPRVTVGADWLGGTRFLTAEYHYNGIGRARPEAYLEAAGDARVRRGESYFLGRHYVGLGGSFSPDEQARLTLAATTLANVGDRSLILAPHLNYDVGQAARISVGGLASVGRSPELVPAPLFVLTRSEFGLYGNALFTTLSIYF